MAEQNGFRYTRRKQAYPRRKNVEMPEDTEAEHLENGEPCSRVSSTPSSPAPPTSPDIEVADPSPLPPVKNGCPEVTNGHVTGTEVTRSHVTNGVKAEADKIREYMERTDTAVIFPEPAPPGGATTSEGAKMVDEYVLKCPRCDRVFTGPKDIQTLKDHLVSYHGYADDVSDQKTDAKNYVCPKCNATFTEKENLAKHKLFHSAVGQRHVISQEENAVLRKFKCPECGKAFKFKHHLKEHIRIHSGEKPFACSNCGKRFSHSGSYSSHMTSKKCLVMNLKVKKMDSKPMRGQSNNQQNVAFRPIIPKYGAATEGVSLMPHGYVPPTDRFPGFLPGFHPAQQHAGHPSPFLSTHYSSIPYHHLLTSHLNSAIPPPSLAIPNFPDVTQLLQPRTQNNTIQELLEQRLTSNEPPSSLCVTSSICVSSRSPRSSTPPAIPDGDGAASPKRNNINAVKKILEIVDATVSRQQNKTGSNIKNGLIEEDVVTPTQDSAVSSPTTTDVERLQCLHCDSRFDTAMELQNHERYRCRGKEDGYYATCSDRNITNGYKDTLDDGDHCTEKPKNEIIRLVHELGYPPRVVQACFQPEQQQTTSPRPSTFLSPYNGMSCHVASRYDEDQPLDLSMKSRFQNVPTPPRHVEYEVLNLSNRSSGTSTPLKDSNNSDDLEPTDDVAEMKKFHNGDYRLSNSMLYKYMQKGAYLTNHRQMSQIMVKCRSPDIHESYPDQASSANHVSPLSVCSYDVTRPPSSSDCGSGDGMESPGVIVSLDNSSGGDPGSPKCRKLQKRPWKQLECDESQSAIEDSPGPDDQLTGEKRRKSWKQHKMESEEGMYACDQCDKMFSKQSSLARHKYEHSGQRPHKCDVCNKAFKHKHHLTEHKRLHSGEKPFQCKKCLKRFSHSGSYSQHMNHRYSYCKPYQETQPIDCQ